MAIIAKGSDNIWESFQVAKDGHIRQNGGQFQVEIVRGILRKGVLRSEFRTKVLGKNVFQVRVAYDLQIDTDQRADGEAVTMQVWDGGSPSNSIRWDYNTNELFYRLFKESSRQDFEIGQLQRGAPARIVFILNGREDNNGSVEIYFNGNKVVDYKGRTLYGRLDSDPYIKFGLYDDDDLPRSISNRKVTFNNIILGNQNTTLQELGVGSSHPEPEPQDPVPVPSVPTKEIEDLKNKVASLQTEFDKINQENIDLKNKIQSARNILS